jgi:hypothetical protein
MNDEMRAMLTKIAEGEIGCDSDDFMVDDYAGGNIDDAYSMGIDHGEVLFARQLLAKFPA